MIFIPEISTPREERRGVVLLVVIALLALFAAVALSFVFYAEAEAAASDNYKNSVTKMQPDVDPELLLAYFLGQLIYDADDTNGVYSALRGHSLARNAWGYNYTNQGGTYYISPNGIPFTGIGKAANNNVINYTLYPTDGSIMIPERAVLPVRGASNASPIQITSPNHGFATGISVIVAAVEGNTAANGTWTITQVDANTFSLNGSTGNANYTGGGITYPSTAAQTYLPCNAAYTFPDRNNMYLGAVNAGGEVLIQSFYRPWMETSGVKHSYLRPDSSWNSSFSIPDADGGGHVKNLENSPGTVYYSGGIKKYYINDSWWIDPGFPIQIAPNGQKFKPLFAAFVTDMDNKLNLNAHGNIRVNNNTHASSAGLGPWEVNISKVLTQSDWTNIFLGNTGTYPGLYGRYDQTNGTPTKKGDSGASLTNPPIYSQYDLDGALTDYSNLSNKYVAPFENPVLGATQAKPIQITATNHGFSTGDTIVVYGAQGNTAANGTWTITLVDKDNFTLDTSDGTASGAYTGSGAASPYPSFFGFPYYRAASFGNSGANEILNHPSLFNVFDPSYKSPSSLRIFDWSHTEALLRYRGTNSPAQTSDLFRLCPQSLNLASFPRNGWLLTPHSFDFGRPGATPWLYPNAGNAYQLVPATAPYPQLTTATGIASPAFPASPNNGEFGLDWRGLAGSQGLNSGKGTTSVGALLRRLDLNRTLTSYTVDAKQAIKDRQQFAKDIFDRLRLATTGNWPGDAFPGAGVQYDALQWLAQLAVNIVDYIDDDNNITPWQWDPGNNNWVYGTEMPRLVINEFYSEVMNNPADTAAPPTQPFIVNFWVELLNPLRDDGANTYDQTLQDASKSIYELVIGTLPPPAISTTDPTAAPPNIKLDVKNFKDGTGALPAVVKPAGTSYSGPNGSNQGFYVLGPTSDALPGGAVTATVKVQWGASAAAVAAGGNTYQVGDTITLAGGTFNYAAVLTVTSVTGGAITGVSVSNAGSYSVVPTNPVSQATTSGTGTGATFNMTWGNRMTYTLAKETTNFNIPHNVYLRRLACPSMAFNDNKADALYNPYVTVDYVTNNPLNDAVKFDINGAHSNYMNVDQRYSVGKRQPYAAYYNGAWSVSQVVGAGRPLSNASNTAPIKITLANHGFSSGDKVVINGVNGFVPPNTPNNTPGNKSWTITKTGADDFTLNGSDGTGGAYSGGGLVYNATYYDFTQPQHTFFRHNALEKTAPPSASTVGQTLKLPFDWLVHLDRSVMSPIEIMQVCAYPPHRLTQQFMLNYGSNRRFQHLAGVFGNPLAAWTDQTALLYRVFEFLEIGSLAQGVAKDKGRIPGLINLNTVWDQEILQALADPQLLSRFSATDVGNILASLLNSRNPNLTNVGNAGFTGNTFAGDQLNDQTVTTVNYFNDRPFRNLSAGVVPNGDSFYYPSTVLPNALGINDTLFRNNMFQITPATTPALLDDNPYQKMELLSKIFNNVTTRSNVFAVWLTVGFFEVTDDTVTPARLGKEIGRSEGRHIRHRMFAMVDRSAMLIPSQLTTLSADITAAGLQAAKVGAISGTTSLAGSSVIGTTNWGTHNATMTWMIQPGTTLIVDQGLASEEVVVVTATATTPPTITANFVNTHTTGASIAVYGSPGPIVNGTTATVHGYPGPQSRFDPRNNTAVVPYFSVIQ